MTLRELVMELEKLGYAGDTLEVGFFDGDAFVPITEADIEQVKLTVRNKNWHPTDSPEVFISEVKERVVLS